MRPLCLAAVFCFFLSYSTRGTDLPQIISIDADTTRRAAWQANALYSVSSRRSYEDFLLLGWAVQTYNSDPNADPNETLKFLNKVRDYYEVRHKETTEGYRVPEGPVEGIQSALTIAGTLGGLKGKAYVELGKEVLKVGVKSYEALVRDSSRVDAQRFEAANQDLAWDFGKKYTGQALLLAAINNNFKTVLDTYFGDQNRFNALSTDTSDTIRQKNPTFAVATDIANVARDQQGLKVAVDDLKKTFVATTNLLARGVEANRLALQQMDARQRSLVAYLIKRDVDQRNAENAIEQRQLTINGARAAVYLLATFAQLGGNARLARDITVVGNSAIQISEAINNYSRSVNRFGTFGQAASSAILMSNFLSAGLAIANLGSEKEDNDQLIMQQLVAISRQISQLAQDMHSRFDRIEQTLSLAFRAVTDNFRELALLQSETLQQVMIARRDINDIETQLADLRTQLELMQSQTNQSLRVGFDREFRKELLSCLDHEKFYDASAMTLEAYQTCQLEFTLHATDTARDYLSTGGQRGSVDDATLASSLLERPPYDNLNLLAQIGSSMFDDRELSGFVGKTANLTEWLIGAEAYLAMASRYPNLTNQVSRESVDKIITAGEELNGLVGALRGADIYSKLVRNYRNKLNDLSKLISEKETDYRKTYIGGYDLWAGVGQTSKHTFRALDGATIPSCIDRAPPQGWIAPNMALSTPVNLRTALPVIFATAEDLEIGALDVCFEILEFSQQNSRRERELHFGFGSFKNYADKLLINPSVRIEIGFRFKQTAELLPLFVETVAFDSPVHWASEDVGDGSYAPVLKGPRYDSQNQQKGMMEAPKTISDNWTAGAGLQGKANGDFQLTKVAGRVEKKTSGLITETLSKKFLQAERGFYLGLADKSLDQNSFNMATRALDGSKVAIEAFTVASLGTEIEEDDALRALLFGKERLLGADEILQEFRFATEPVQVRQKQISSALEQDGFIFSCQTFFEQIALRNKAVVVRFIQGGIEQIMSDFDEDRARELLANWRRDNKKVGTLRLQGRFVESQGPVDHGAPIDLINRQLLTRSLVLDRLLSQYATEPEAVRRATSVKITLERLRLFRDVFSIEARSGVLKGTQQ